MNLNQLIVLVGRVLTNGPGDLDSIPGRVIPKTLKMALDTALLITQQYTVRIKGKVEQPMERSSALPYTFWSPSTTVANNNNNYKRIYIATWVYSLSTHLFVL